ncbi:MAG: hypothetical protein K8R68_00700, partial [Bacteroidales bacterium]|nr:hypothetical protein [Bacteroidales bacterium]
SSNENIMADTIRAVIVDDFSPLHWCLEGFYILFLKGGNFVELFNILIPLFIFIVCCQLIAYLKLRVEKII